jgi:senataxin
MQTNHPKNVHLLDTQYRMHPEISVFPSDTFYDSRLLDGPGMAKLRDRPWHAAPLLGPYRFFDVQGQHQAAPKGHSLINLAEIDVAIQLYERLMADFGSYDLKAKIGIITPYKSQLAELKTRFSRRYGQTILDLVEFNTTDAFQGRESEVIIFSCVRASPSGNIGFLQDIRRMNVGLTRAKSSLWVLGNSDSLMRGEFWAKLIDDAKRRDRFSHGNYMQQLKKPSPAAAMKMDEFSSMVSSSTPSLASLARKSGDATTSMSNDVSMSDASDSSSIKIGERKVIKKVLDSEGYHDASAAKWQAQTPKPEEIEYNDVEMEDAPPLKSESKPSGKLEAKPGSSISRAVGLTAGSRPPQVIKKVKRKEAANPLIAPNRPKKPKTG